MTRNVKPSLEKKLDIDGIITKLLKSSGLKMEEFLYRSGISLDAYRKMVDRGKLSANAVQNILDNFDVNEGLLKGTEDLTLSGKLTSVQKGSDNTNKPLGGDPEVYRTIVEGNTEYVLIPRTVLKDTKLISVQQIENDRKIMDKLLEQNEKMITKLLTSETQLPGVKKGENSP